MPEIIQRLHFGLVHCERCGFRSSTTVNASKVPLYSEAVPCSCLNSIFHFLVHQGVTFLALFGLSPQSFPSKYPSSRWSHICFWTATIATSLPLYLQPSWDRLVLPCWWSVVATVILLSTRWTADSDIRFMCLAGKRVVRSYHLMDYVWTLLSQNPA